MARRKNQNLIIKWFPTVSILGSIIFALVGGLITWSIWISKNVAQTSYVDELSQKTLKYVDLQNEKTIKYIDEKIVVLRQESFSHSDFNKSVLESEYKGLSAKIDMMILMLGQKGKR
jgi:hypothetical protein